MKLFTRKATEAPAVIRTAESKAAAALAAYAADRCIGVCTTGCAARIH